MDTISQRFMAGVNRGNATQMEGLQSHEKDQLCQTLDDMGILHTIDIDDQTGKRYTVSAGQWETREGWARIGS